MINIENERRHHCRSTNIKEYYKQLHANMFNNLDEMANIFKGTGYESSLVKKQPKQPYIYDRNEFIGKNLPTKTIPGMHSITEKFCQPFKGKITQIPHKLFH